VDTLAIEQDSNEFIGIWFLEAPVTLKQKRNKGTVKYSLKFLFRVLFSILAWFRKTPYFQRSPLPLASFGEDLGLG
jgi:hypothetical protein